MGRKQYEQTEYVLSDKTQSKMGTKAVDIEKNIFQIDDNRFVKIYSMREILKTEERKKGFYDFLSKITTNRIRITWFCKNSDKKFTLYMFMTVFYNAENFTEAADKAKLFETSFQKYITDTICISLNEEKWSKVLSYICMNASGKTREISVEEFLGKKSNWYELLESKKIQKCYVARNFPNKDISIVSLLENCTGEICFCTDFQFMTDEDNRLLDLIISNKYNTKLDLPQKKVVNVSSLWLVSAEVKEEQVQIEKNIEDFFYENEILLYSGKKQQQRIFDSINSLGLSDFCAMENTEPCMFRSLLL